MAAMRASCKKHERDIAILTAQLAAAGIQPLLAAARSALLMHESSAHP